LKSIKDQEEARRGNPHLVMEEQNPTQNDSLSPTQPNSDSVYHNFDLQRVIMEDYPSTSTPDDTDAEGLQTQNNPHKLHPDSAYSRFASVRTESTALTFQEDDPRHIKLDVPSGANEMKESQTASYAELQQDLSSYNEQRAYEPETPAPPVNPFFQRGSVLKPSELFLETPPQPSAIGPRFATPTSSRPSPNVYNDYSSPQKHGQAPSSPLQPTRFAETSPLQSSVHEILASSMSVDQALMGRKSGAQSFHVLPRTTRKDVTDPRPYVSMQESQERRLKEAMQDSDSDGSDSDIEPVPKRRMGTDSRMRRELSAVVVTAKDKIPVSSRPTSSYSVAAQAPSNSSAVEVPSTSTRRQRSIQEEYVVQCEGHDVREIQQSFEARITKEIQQMQNSQETQDDVIADSQARSGDEERRRTSEPAEIPTSPTNGGALIQDAEHEEALGLEAQAKPNKEIHSTVLSSRGAELHSGSGSTGNNTKTAQGQPVLPLQEVSNQDDFRTPSKTQQSLGTETVPETSPPEQRIRPMGDIATISFSAGADVLMENLPGFSEDVEYQNLMNLGSSPKARLPRNFYKVQGTAKLATVSRGSVDEAPEQVHVSNHYAPSKAMERAANDTVTSSLLSDPPSTIDDIEPLSAEKEDSANIENLAETIESIAQIEEITDGDLQTSSVPSSPPILPSKTKKIKTTKKMQESPDAIISAEPRQSSRITKSYSKKSTASRIPLPRVSAARNSAISRSSPLRSEVTPDTDPAPRASKQKSFAIASATLSTSSKRTAKRKSGVTVVENQTTRLSKRQSIARESSEDPLAFAPTLAPGILLFAKMAFAVTYVHEAGREKVTKLILDNGGQILKDGFETLFESSRGQSEADAELRLTVSASALGFTAVIADNYSRKAKYMQALALGLPCISGYWVEACVTKGQVISWSPYLLSAGQSSILGNAVKSRVLVPYNAETARFEETFSGRDKLLDGKSILIVTGKGKAEEKRRAYTFLSRALGPTRTTQVPDLQTARKILVNSEADGTNWDMLYVDNADENAAQSVVFGATPSVIATGKRKRVSKGTAEDATPPPTKKIRIIADEIMMQSLILGQFIE
jgi:hypothetical protein